LKSYAEELKQVRKIQNKYGKDEIGSVIEEFKRYKVKEKIAKENEEW